jgi:hypothetical protein
MQLNIKAIQLDDVLANDKIKYNTNNHWDDNKRPEDYDQVISNVQTNKWIDQFRTYKKIIINTKQDLYWMKEAYEIGSKTKRFPKMFDDELEDMINRYKNLTDTIFTGEKYFIRCEGVSLKEGKHGVGPYVDFKSVIESMVTCRHGHSPIYQSSTEIVLYLCPFIENMNHMNEFRIFVCKNRITAISQQAIYDINDILDKLNDLDKNELIKRWIDIIQKNFEEEIKKKITHIDSYVMDFAILDDNTPYFIELNSFGKQYASGSALFEWITDYDVLYGLKGEDYIEFRYTINF